MPDFMPSTARDFYTMVEQAISLLPDVRRAYTIIKKAFDLLLEQNTMNVKVVFRGPYPKTDYLLKEHDAPFMLRRRVHQLRVRLRHLREQSADELQAQIFTDIEALAEFVRAIYGDAVPATITAHYGEAHPDDTPRLRPFADVERMLVNSLTDSEICGQIDALPLADDITVQLNDRLGDQAYVLQLLTAGSIINLVRPVWVEEGRRLRADYIIYEPDYLVDISAIAACFEHYGTTAYNHLLKKIKPSQSTYHTLLGNYSSQLLDEAAQKVAREQKNANARGAEQDVAEPALVTPPSSNETFFHTYPLSLTRLTDSDMRQLAEDGRRQRTNIDRALTEGLPGLLHDKFKPDEAMLEATFFVEMLGMQGRLDYLQLDGRFLMEQKSGKGEWPDPEGLKTPRAKLQHLVQVSLYMFLLRYAYADKLKALGGNVHSFLLYTRYDNSLYSQGFTPTDLLQEAVRVRNQLAYTEMQYAKPDGFRLLESLRADMFNRNKVGDNLWLNYKKPEIDSLLCTIQQAQPVERAYCLRFLNFLASEHLLSKIGNKVKENSGFASKWYASLDDKLAAGNIYARLHLAEPNATSAQPVERMVFEFEETAECDMANFRVGDIVVAYPYDEGTEPDIRKTMVFRCSVAAITATTIELRLRAAQSSLKAFLRDKDRPWAIEHDFFESSYNGLYRGVYAFLQAPLARRQLLMMQRRPALDMSITELKADHPEAFRPLALHVKQAQDFFLIIGPPGTGKTSFGLMTTLNEQLAEPDTNILLMSYTNRAVDEICQKLEEQGLDYVRVGSPLSASPQSQSHCLLERVQCMHKVAELKAMIARTRIFVGTTSALTGASELFNMKQFALAIIDEASQILEPHLLPLLSAVHDGQSVIRKFVMIGDHKQLPAVVQQTADVSAVTDPALHAIGLTDCRLSLFERLLRRYASDPSVVFMLTRQGRMHPDIARFPNEVFYAGRLQPVPVPHQQVSLPQEVDAADDMERMLLTRRIAFINVPAPAVSPSDKVNQAEADVIAELVRRIYRLNAATFEADRTVGVIVPYRNQIATVRNTLARLGIPELADITIDTVERYQGSQRKYIVYGFTVQHLYQLKFLTDNVFEDIDGTLVDRKLNVAMTRAEEHLIMLGDAALLSADETFEKLIRFCDER